MLSGIILINLLEVGKEEQENVLPPDQRSALGSGS